MAGPRPDITDTLVHYIRGANPEEAFRVLKNILREQRLRCGTGYIRGGHCCVCFSEAPFRYLGWAIAEGYRAERPYHPFGILVKKDWLFAQGGRPVVYQLESQYTELPESHRWRHVRYDPCANPAVDFTWEREWRVRVDELPIDPNVAEVVLPSKEFLDMLHHEHEREQDHYEDMYRQIFDELTAWQLRSGYPWHVHTLAPDGSVARELSWTMPPIFSPAHLEAICKVLGDTTTGLTGAEIGRCLQQVGVTDNDPALTKWMRLYDALAARHNKDGHGDRVLAFIKVALDPPRYIGKAGLFELRCDAVNVCLAFHGLSFREDGKFHRTTVATTLSEAEDRAKRLRTALEPRGIHPDVIRYCRAEFLQNNCFHAVLEASKSVAEKLRQKSGFTSDGAELVDAALGGQDPLLRINGFSTENEKSEQRGFVNLAKGLFGTFRNPTAHALRIEWPLSEQDALDLFALASYVHRRVDTATKR